MIFDDLTLSRRRPISYRNQFIDLRSKSMDWFLYNVGLRHERVKLHAIKNIFYDKMDLRLFNFHVTTYSKSTIMKIE